MKKDNLEKFITENRSVFDNETPNLKIWANIDKALESQQQQPKIPWWRNSRVAAAAIMLIVASSALGYFLAPKSENSVIAYEYSEEFQDMTSFYERQLQDKTARLVSYEHQDKSVQQDIEQFDKAMAELELEIQNAPKGSEEIIINAMIQNYQAKVFILNRVLQQLNSSNQHLKKKKNGTVNL